MSYQCLDCTYSGTRFEGGACPGCGSNRIKRLGKPPELERPVAKRTYRSALAFALWLYLFFKGLQLAEFI
jgi:hypothetical protein